MRFLDACSRSGFLPVLCLSLASTFLFACAKEHSIEELIGRTGGRGVGGNASDQNPVGIVPVMGPLDAGGPHPVHDVGFDAGGPRISIFDARISFPSDASVPDARVPTVDGAVIARDGGVRDASADAGDANLPPWRTNDAATVDVNVAVACTPALADAGAAPDAGAATDAGTSDDAGCRAVGWHTPPCYRAPVECPALHESTYCMGFNANSDLLIYGLDLGTSCRIPQDPKYALGAGSNSFAQIGPDIYSIENDVILKRAISDGTFDVAPAQGWTIFNLGDSLVVQGLDGAIRRFDSWQALKSGAMGETIATATSGTSASFGANHNAIAAAWPDGSLYLLTVGDARQRSLRLSGYNRAESGSIHGLDLADDGRLYVATDMGISTYNSTDGRLLARLRTPPLFGLSCQPGMAADAAPPALAATARPGYYAPDGTDYIITSSDCRGPFNGPRYVGEKAGPELLVVGNFFGEPSTVRDQRSTPHTLVLTTVQSTQWNVVVEPNAKLERIIVNGSTSMVTVQSATSIPIDTYYDMNALGQHPGEWPSFEEAQFESALEKKAGRAITEIFGCHFGSNYLIRDLPPTCPAP